MKKLLTFIILFFTGLLIVNAEKCTMVSGNGTNIGDELACGTEHFYVLSNDGTNIKLLAKYNLYVGSIYYKIEFDQTFETWKEIKDYYDENYADKYDGYERFITNDSDEYYGALVYKLIETDEIKQSEEAIGAHGDLKVEPLFPEVGVYNHLIKGNKMYFSYIRNSNDVYSSGYSDFDINLSSEKEADLLDYLKGYNDYLSNINIEVDDITILAVSDISSLVYDVTGNYLPLEEWWNNRENWGIKSNGITSASYVVGSIKDLMPDGFEWLWSTTYWTRTIPEGRYMDELDFEMYFVDTNGDLCDGDYCEVSVGAGIRPVVSMAASNVIYYVETKTDGNGSIEADHIDAEEGTVVKFTVTPKEGYVLGEVKVTDKNGNVVIFTNYTFTMPNADVLIEATFVPENPDTVDKIILLIITIFAIGLVIIHNNKKRISLK